LLAPQAHFLYVLTHQIRAYPAFSFLGGLLELLFLLSIALSAALRLLVHLLLSGPLTLTPQLLGHPSALPTLEDDWGVAVLKLAQAGLGDLSRRAGLGNELVELNERAEEGGEVWVGKSGVELRLPSPSAAASPGSAAAAEFGFNREIKHIRVKKSPGQGGSVYSVLEWVQAGWRLLRTVGGVARGFHRRFVLKPQDTPAPRGPPIIMLEDGETISLPGLVHMDDELAARAGEGRSEEELVYARFLAGMEEEGEEEDEDWRDGEEEEEGEGTEDDVEDEDAMDGEGGAGPGMQEAEREADEREDSGLYSDLLLPAADGTAEVAAATGLTPVLVAHLTTAGALTRRRYQALVLHSPAGGAREDTAEWRAFLEQRRSGGAQAQVDWSRSSETALMCAVCMSEPRQVVCWPCRCLAMCDECRAGIAARFVLRGQHTCPCCRQPVEGYSRIFIP